MKGNISFPTFLALCFFGCTLLIAAENHQSVASSVIQQDESEILRPEGWTEETHGDTATADYEAVFAQDVVKRIDLIIDLADWEAMHSFEMFPEGISQPPYRPCTFMFEGKTWWHVGVRFKGQSTLIFPSQSGNMKLPLRFDFDKFEDDYPGISNQRFLGFDDLALGNNCMDNSLIRDKVAYDVFREAGMPAPQSAFYRVFVDLGQGFNYLGLYTMVEVPREPMFAAQFGDSDGNLYKPEGRGARWVTFDQESFAKKTNRDENDWSDVEASFAALHASQDDPTAWRAGLEAVFDVEGFLRWLAINTVIQNWDTYGRMPQNYYIYTDPSDGLIHWIPWDYNMAFMKLSSPHISLERINEDWPLIRYLMDDPVYHAFYNAFVYDTVEGVYSVARSQTRFQEAHDLIASYVIGPEGEQPGYTCLDNSENFEDELNFLLNHVWRRRWSALLYLAGEDFVPGKLVINEVHYNPSPDQGEGYEFIELLNGGDATIDLSGYSFADGIEFTFPSDTYISPGEYMVIAQDAAMYSGLGYQIFEWTNGQLANGGENIQLKDNIGIEIDRVKYDDISPWPASPDGDGPSLELINAAQDNYIPENWQPSSVVGGTPGLPNS